MTAAGNFTEAIIAEIGRLRLLIDRIHILALRSGAGMDPDKDQIAALCREALKD